MGSGVWFKNILRRNRSKERKRKQAEKSNGSKSKHTSAKEDDNLLNGGSKKNSKRKQMTEDAAAIRIQSAFRAHKARKALQRLRGIVRFRGVIEGGHYMKSQSASALNQIHFWSRIQAEIKARWLGMVAESQTRQKRLENQLKLEAKLHELEVEWSGGPETMEEILSRIQQREEAAAKRERAMAYAFSHQWRANTNNYFGQAYYDLSKEGWGWSWKERWIAARPWENRYQPRTSLVKKSETSQKTNTVIKAMGSIKPLLSNGKASHGGKSSQVSHSHEPAA
ncbi:protein IQ-DOMAIN 10 isoform X2 [Andrographis paniculata]|nr:protein IQ-DOMAIN 10 isoform X2 [Andrographis paniculata]XP_051114519.1 protein IQ-DOMAIN 10 isoform X2 [Andrographis paniculata]